MNLHQLIFTESDCYKEGMAKKQFIKPIAPMWHSTAANNPYLKRYVGPDDGLLGKNIYNNHWNQPRDRRVCYHAFVGKLKDDTIASYQVLPWDLRGWHSGSGKNGNGNSLGYIGICICEDNLKDKDYAMAAYKEACELSAYICELYSLDPMNIIDHAEGYRLGIASNHGDVDHWFRKLYGITLDNIRRDVAALITPEPAPPPTPTPTPTPDDKVLAWMKANTLRLGSKGKLVGYLQSYLERHGYEPVAIDDDFGPKTKEAVTRLQGDKELYRDGIVGPQTWEAIMK
jgi:N-acetylmuramoyl-L-alanine amidase